MLKKVERITLTGESMIEGVCVAGMQATIDSDNPEEISFSHWQNDQKLYKANRVTVRADIAEFEDYAYSRQDELLAGGGSDAAEK